MPNTLSAQQIADAAAGCADHLFSGAARTLAGMTSSTANVTWVDLQTAVSAIDIALNVTLTQAVAAVGGNTTVINGLAQQLSPPVSNLSAQAKTIILCYVLLKRAGLV